MDKQGTIELQSFPTNIRPSDIDSEPWPSFSKRLVEFGKLRANWDHDNAPAPSQASLAGAGEFLTSLRRMAFVPSRLSPSVVGGIGFTFRLQDRRVYVEFNNDGQGHMLLSDDRSEPTVERLIPADIDSQIHQAKEFLNAR